MVVDSPMEPFVMHRVAIWSASWKAVRARSDAFLAVELRAVRVVSSGVNPPPTLGISSQMQRSKTQFNSAVR